MCPMSWEVGRTTHTPNTLTPNARHPSTRGVLLNDDEVEKASAYRHWQEELGSWLTRFHWDLYATPTFRFPVTYPTAKATVERWITSLGPQVFAYVAYERGLAGGRTHCHVLLGGLHPLLTLRAGRRWRHGNITIESYDPHRGAAWYVAKVPEAGEILGHPISRAARARGR